jgi:hypothetical protein
MFLPDAIKREIFVRILLRVKPDAFKIVYPCKRTQDWMLYAIQVVGGPRYYPRRVPGKSPGGGGGGGGGGGKFIQG